MSHTNFRVTVPQDGTRQFDGNRGHSSGMYQSRGTRSRGRHYSNQRNFRAPSNTWSVRAADQDDAMGGDDQSNSGGSRKPFRPPYNARYKGGHQRGRGVDRRHQQGRLSDQMISRIGVERLIRSNSVGGFSPGGCTWFQVRVKNVKSLGRDFVIQQITSVANVQFTPYCIYVEENDIVFYVKDYAISKAIEDTNRRVTLPATSAKMVVVVANMVDMPPVIMSQENIGKLTLVLSDRYSTVDMSLDASNLNADNELRSNGINVMFLKPIVGATIVDIIGEHIPELRKLNLSNNRIEKFEGFDKLSVKAPKLVSLNLSGNRVNSEHDLVPFQKLELLELQLDGNRIRDRFKTQVAYVSAIRRRFPKIVKLDGVTLPPAISFEIDVPTTLPVTKGSYFISDHTKDLISRFVEQYFGLYDTDKRAEVGAAYHDEAKLSVCCYSCPATGKKLPLNDYQPHSRNLKAAGNGLTLLKSGQANIMKLLTQLPATQHDLLSFVVDVNLEAATILTFTISGIFKEVSSKTKAIRQFRRTFVTVPNGQGLAIINELMTVMNPTQEATEKFKDPIAPAAAAAIIGAVSPSSGAAVALSPEQQEMVKQFSMASSMNEEFSMRCLVENAWDYTKAAQIFSDLNAKGGIPPQAFIR